MIPTGTTATFYVVASNSGCTSQVSAATVSNYNIHAGGSASVYTGNVPINVNFTNLSAGINPGDNVLWIFGDSTSATTYDASHNYIKGGHYNVELIITQTASGCVDTAIISVYYQDVSILVIPNIFTPNGDNINDAFTITGVGLKTFHAEIFDRWGLKLYTWDSALGGWDGRIKGGASASDGTYFYIIKASGIDGKEYNEHGAFQLTR
jgi:gliding motility-associated-like protein